MKAKAEGYYILWEDRQIFIDSSGYLDEWPKGFFDTNDIQLETLLCWR